MVKIIALMGNIFIFLLITNSVVINGFLKKNVKHYVCIKYIILQSLGNRFVSLNQEEVTMVCKRLSGVF